MQLVDWLDDLCVRFIINLQQEELEEVERICFQVEEAQWFYEDFIRPLDPTLPSLNLRQFCLLIFRRCPILSTYTEDRHVAAFNEFLAYKTRVPVRGAIMLNSAMDQVLLVKGWKKSANWSFPRGKINKDERDLDCAIREAYEETGFDLAAAGLVPDETNVKYIEVTMREQHMRLYVFRDVPQNIDFQPKTRKEISKIEWYTLASLPGWHKNKNAQHHESEDALNANKLYMVAPFLGPLKKWIAQQKKLGAQPSTADYSTAPYYTSGMATDDYITDDYAQQAVPHVASFTQAPSSWNAKPSQISEEPLWQNESVSTFPLSTTAGATDASAQLKQLLSVGQPSAAPNLSPLPVKPAATSTSAANSANLLALLRQGSTPANDASSTSKSPLAQDSHGVIEPKSPQHQQHNHHARSHASATYLPFQSSQEPNQFQQQHAVNNPRAYTSAIPSGLNSLRHTMDADNFSPQVWTGPPQLTRMPTTSLSQVSAHQIAQNAVGDIHSDRLPTKNQRTTPPPASSLPQPKLSNHHMNLLSVFKNSNTSATVQQPQQLTAEQPLRTRSLLAPEDKEKLGLPALGPDAVDQHLRTHVIPAKQSPAAPVLGPETLSQTMKTVTEPSSAKRPTAQQNALLNLFRSPAQGTSPTLLKPTELSAVRTPTERIELPAIKSPGPIVQPPGPNSPKAEPSQVIKSPKAPRSPRPPRTPRLSKSPRQVGSPSRQAKISASSDRKNTSPKLTSATLSGPLNVPDFGPVRQKRQHSKGNKNNNNSWSPQQEVSQKIAPAPVQILKRPTSAIASDQSPKQMPTDPPKETKDTKDTKDIKGGPSKPATVPRVRRSAAKETKAEPAKPFQPQILRRPQPATIASANQPESPTKASKEGVVATQSQNSSSNPVITASTPSAEASASTATTAVKQRDSSTTAASEHKKSLLSLFSQPKSALTKSPPIPIDNRSAMTASPLSIRPASIVSAPRRPSEGALSRSGADSSNTGSIDGRAVTATAAPAISGGVASSATMRSRISSAVPLARERTRSGSQTPISPSDRGFLLSYLDGVVKSASSASSTPAATNSQKTL